MPANDPDRRDMSSTGRTRRELRDCTAWVFDLDGTLTINQHDFDAIRAELAVPRGRLILEYLDSLPDDEAAPLHDKLNAIELALASSAKPATGARELLGELAARGAHLGIVTRNTRRTALATLEAAGLDDCFAPEFILGRHETVPKPSPAGIVRLLESWSVAACSAVMVGDVGLDLEAGRNAGVATVHMREDGDRAWPEITDYRFRTLAALKLFLAD